MYKDATNNKWSNKKNQESKHAAFVYQFNVWPNFINEYPIFVKYFAETKRNNHSVYLSCLNIILSIF